MKKFLVMMLTVALLLSFSASVLAADEDDSPIAGSVEMLSCNCDGLRLVVEEFEEDDVEGRDGILETIISEKQLEEYTLVFYKDTYLVDGAEVVQECDATVRVVVPDVTENDKVIIVHYTDDFAAAYENDELTDEIWEDEFEIVEEGITVENGKVTYELFFRDLSTTAIFVVPTDSQSPNTGSYSVPWGIIAGALALVLGGLFIGKKAFAK